MKALIAITAMFSVLVLHAAEAAFVTFSATKPVIERETITALWAPAANFDITKWIELEWRGSNEWLTIERKVTAVRNGGTTFTVPEPGAYRLRYVDRSLAGTFQSELAVSGVLSVLEVIPDPRRVKNFPPKDVAIVFTGDSLVAGKGASSGNSLPAQLERLLGIRIVNAGRSGDTTAQILARLDADVLAHKPALVLILAGWNDYRTGVPSDATFRNLREMTRRAQERGAMVVIVGVRKPFFDDFEHEFRALTDETGAGYAPNVLWDTESNIRFWNIGAAHPNDAGYARMAERIAPGVRKLLMTPPVLHVGKEANHVVISWQSLFGKTYRLRETENLVVPIQWRESVFIGSGRVMEVSKMPAMNRFLTLAEE